MHQMGKYYIEYTSVMTYIVYVNIIGENILVQVGFDVNQHMILNKCIKQRVGPESLTITNIHYNKWNVFKRHERATCVCEVCVQQNYGSKYWVAKKYIHDSHPVELSKCDISVDIQHEPEIFGVCPTQ